jgi:hypothetical protein
MPLEIVDPPDTTYFKGQFILIKSKLQASYASAGLGRLTSQAIMAILDYGYSRFYLPYYQSYFRAISLIGCVSPV